MFFPEDIWNNIKQFIFKSKEMKQYDNVMFDLLKNINRADIMYKRILPYWKVLPECDFIYSTILLEQIK
tara:strand:+ start:210 stop:416 length:207 start_codon:yes stop_codon:yes gene_type:complete